MGWSSSRSWAAGCACGFGRSLEKRPVQYPPPEADQGSPWSVIRGGDPSRGLWVSSTAFRREGHGGDSSDSPRLGSPPGAVRRGRHPAVRATLPTAEVLGTPPPLVRTSPEEKTAGGIHQALGRAGSPTGDPKLPRPRRERVAPSRSCNGGCQYRIKGAPTQRPG